MIQELDAILNKQMKKKQKKIKEIVWQTDRSYYYKVTIYSFKLVEINCCDCDYLLLWIKGKQYESKRNSNISNRYLIKNNVTIMGRRGRGTG